MKGTDIEESEKGTYISLLNAAIVTFLYFKKSKVISGLEYFPELLTCIHSLHVRNDVVGWERAKIIS